MNAFPTLLRALAACAVLAIGAAPRAGVAGFLDPPPAADDGVLPAEQAFIVQPALWDHGNLIVGWSIAPNCYLYRSKISVEPVDPPGYPIGPAALPNGTLHVDEHFGETEIYRDGVQVTFRPFASAPPRRLRVKYQGCAENKVCYPMQTRTIEVIPP